jgi:hypothetical protein
MSASESQDDGDIAGGDLPEDEPMDEEIRNFLQRRNRRRVLEDDNEDYVDDDDDDDDDDNDNDDDENDDDDDDEESRPLLSWEEESARTIHRALSLVLAMAAESSSSGMNNDNLSTGGAMDGEDNVDDNEELGEGGDQPLPREHSYLDASHPLLADEDAPYLHRNWKRPRSDIDENTIYPPGILEHDNAAAGESPTPRRRLLELAVMELQGVVLFPGQTIPVKVRDRSMIQYLGRQIRLCRTHPDIQPQVQLGILTHEERSRPSSDIIFGTRRRRRSAGEDVRTGHQRSVQEQQRQNRRELLWMRQSFSSSYTIQHNRQRMRAFMLRTGLLLSDDDEDDDRGLTDDDVGGTTTSTTTTSGPSQSPHQHPLLGRIGTIATVKQTHERITGPPVLDSMSSSSSNNNTSRTDGGLWGRYEDATELVFTAVGVSRFRIVGCVDDDDHGAGNGVINGGRRSGSNIFIVEDLNDRPLPRPPLCRPFSSVPWLRQATVMAGPTTDGNHGGDSNVSDDYEDGSNDGNEDDDDESKTGQNEVLLSSLRRQSHLACNLSQLTPVPYFVYQNLCPWSLVEKILVVLQSNNGRGNLPALGDVERTNLERTYNFPTGF